MKQHILLIEDDPGIVEMVGNHLTKEGFAVTAAGNGEEGLTLFGQRSYDVVIVDLMMPKLDGFEVIKRIRERSSVPILIMSAKDGDVDKALGLGFGADDYVAKPFSLIELSARVKASIRRATEYARPAEPQERVITYGPLSLYVDGYRATKQDREIKLTSTEFELLKLFMTNPNRVFTKAQIYGFVWGDDYLGDENVINVHIRRLREKIEDDPSHPVYITTLWGIGYKWEGK